MCNLPVNKNKLINQLINTQVEFQQIFYIPQLLKDVPIGNGSCLCLTKAWDSHWVLRTFWKLVSVSSSASTLIISLRWSMSFSSQVFFWYFYLHRDQEKKKTHTHTLLKRFQSKYDHNETKVNTLLTFSLASFMQFWNNSMICSFSRKGSGGSEGWVAAAFLRRIAAARAARAWTRSSWSWLDSKKKEAVGIGGGHRHRGVRIRVTVW